MTAHVGDTVHLRAAGVSLLLDLSQRRLPRVVHWGADLGELSADHRSALVTAATEPLVTGELDDRHPVSMVPEHSWGWMGTPGLSGHRDGRDHSTRFEVSTTELATGGGGDATVQRLTVQAADAVAQVELSLCIEMLASGLVRARATVSSTGHGSSAAHAPYTVNALNVMLPVPRQAAELLDFTGRWITERAPQRHDFTVGAHLRESRRGKPGHDSPFLMAVGEHSFGFRHGEVWAGHVAWSGSSRLLAERTNAGVGLIGGGELAYPGEIRLAPGDSYQGPWIYASYGAGLDQVSSRFHRYLRSRPDHPHRPRPVIVNTWEAVYFEHDHDTLYALADAAADVGAERFVLDDGWFRHRRGDNAGLGDWYVDTDLYPDGLKPLANYVRAHGLEFGLWCEPEMISPDSDLARAHPEWIAQATLGGGRLPLPARSQQVLDLTHPEAYTYIDQRLRSLVRDTEAAYLKWDHNRDLLEAGSTSTGEPIGHAQTLAYYRLIDGLREEFPDLEIESCAGGGGRIDMEVLSRVQRVWASDCNDAHERQQIQRYTSLLVPPEMMGAHIGPTRAHTTGRVHTLDFRAGTAIWGHLGLEWNVAGQEASTPGTRAQIAAWVTLHKRFRSLFHSGDVVRSDLPVAGRLLHGVVSTDKAEALYGLVSTGSVADNPVGMLRLEGLDPAAQYRLDHVGPADRGRDGMRAAVWWRRAEAGDPLVLSGHALATLGVQAPGLDPDETVLIHVERV